MSKILTQKEKTAKRQEADTTYKIISRSLAKLEISIDHLRNFHGSENIIISPIMKNKGDDGFHCFVNVLPSNSKEEGQ